MIAEFLGLGSNIDFTENELEKCIINHIQKFLMERGKGYAFVARQQLVRTEKEDYYIDLVFYNYILKCFVLIDLKTSKVTHQDVGQMDMYIRMYDEKRRGEGDNPTLGIILCSDTDEDIAKYSVLHGHEQLFASKHKLYLPTEEQLREEIEIQKHFFYLQQQEKKDSENHSRPKKNTSFVVGDNLAAGRHGGMEVRSEGVRCNGVGTGIAGGGKAETGEGNKSRHP